MVINFNKKLFNKKYIDKIQEAYEYALKVMKVPCKDLEVNISFVSKSKIKNQNEKFRNISKVTDVLSFPNLLEPNKTDSQVITKSLSRDNFAMDINPDNNAIFLGDISICKSIVYRHAREYDNSRLREMVYMAVHGLLHLLGYDHMKEEDKKEMREMEEKIMSHVDLRRE
jgi:probable rRNA maturation factor